MQKEILKILHGKELTALQISRELGSVGIRIDVSGLYPVLHRIEKDGLIQARWGSDRPPERGYARRRYYSLSQSGLKEKLKTESLENFHETQFSLG